MRSHAPELVRAPILHPGLNCWRIDEAESVAVLVGAQEYHRAFRAAVRQARHSVLVLGWDFDRTLSLVSGEPADGLPAELGPFLNAVAAHHPFLHVNILAWDFATIYALEKSWQPILKDEWATHRRVHFHLDSRHPLGATHHQKVVVVDDSLAFVGGLDLTERRMEDPRLRAEGRAKSDEIGSDRHAFHDVVMLVSGPAAAALGDLARERWRLFTGKRLHPVWHLARKARWPQGLERDVENVDTAVVLTRPGFGTAKSLREGERLYLDAIAAAERSIYIENPFLTSSSVTEALANRLRDREGPVVLAVLPKSAQGWLEGRALDALRARRLAELREADRFRRLEVVFPVTAAGEPVVVHSKVLVVDDRLIRIGSSNLSNRSMALDTECDLAVESPGPGPVATAITAIRDRLLAHHLGAEPEEVSAAVAEHGLLSAPRIHGGDRLEPLTDVSLPGEAEEIPEADLVDPERPIAGTNLVAALLPHEEHVSLRRNVVAVATIAGLLITLFVAWRYTPLSRAFDLDYLVARIRDLQNSPIAEFAVVGGFAIAALAGIPQTLLITGTALVFPPLPAFALVFSGSLLSAILGWALGFSLGRGLVARLAGARANRIGRYLVRHGVLTVAIARVLPLAPFFLVNLVAGASAVGFRAFFEGTLIGMTPVIAITVVLVDRVRDAATHPGTLTIGISAGIVLVIVVFLVGLSRWLAERRHGM